MASPRRLVDLKCNLPWSSSTVLQSYLRRCGIFERIRRRNGNCQLFRLYKRNKLKKIVLIDLCKHRGHIGSAVCNRAGTQSCVAQLRIEHKDPASNAVEDRIDTIGNDRTDVPNQILSVQNRLRTNRAQIGATGG